VPAGQVVGPGPVVQVCLGVDAVQVLSPGVRVQVLQELLHRLEHGDGAVQVLYGEGLQGAGRLVGGQLLQRAQGEELQSPCGQHQIKVAVVSTASNKYLQCALCKHFRNCLLTF
jgi:hypothetical protein